MDVFDFKQDLRNSTCKYEQDLNNKRVPGASALANNSGIKLEHDLDKELENYLDNEDNINEVSENIQEEDDNNSSETENIDIQDDTDDSDNLEEKEDTDDIDKVNNNNEKENILNKKTNTQQNILDFSNESGIIENIMHTFSDIYVYGRTMIENNYINLSNNEDFSIMFPNVYVANYSTSTNLELLQDLGITHIITVIPSFNPPFPDKFKYLHIEAYDDEWQDMTCFFKETNTFIENCLVNNGKVLIHCMVGRSRSMTIFLAFLINMVRGKCLNFDYNNIKIIGNDAKSNLIEHNNLSKNSKVKRSDINSYKTNNSISNNSNINTNQENVTKNTQELPQLNVREEHFITYKKQNMLNDVDELVCRYKDLKNKMVLFANFENANDPELQKFSNTFIEHLISYSKRYRSISCPNPNFVNQLSTLL